MIKFKRKIPLAWRQLVRTKGRFMVALSGIAFADILMLMQIGFQTALFDSTTRLQSFLNADIVLISPQAQYLGNINSFPRRRLFQASNLPEIESASPLYLSLGVWKNKQTQLKSTILVLGFNPSSSPFNLPGVNENLNSIKYPNTLIFDQNSAGKYQELISQISQGQPMTTELEGRRVNVTGLYSVGASFVAEGSVMTSDQNFLRIFSGQQASQVNVGLITLKPGNDAKTVATKLRSYLQDDVKVLTLQEFIDFEKKYWQESTTIGFIFTFGVVMGFVVGVVVVYQILSSDVADHLPEYATLKAMGYSNLYLLSIVFQEAIILAILGYLPGFLTSTIFYGLIRSATKLPLFMTLGKGFMVLTLTIIMCMVSGAFATQKLRSADPADIF
ncbi:ABC transporter permease DevC [Mastigocoleus testarum]|uniref:ABC transporter n=1 Tax=Mastigocoleus testarum BC008 TaxID=371196 RepID=A0A0V7ZXY4_9CYAN|nr:ABC transporter permease DevC [Mastigocoleus testarum]KST69402.1 ABC transporter [Mastigocoleus testarum BC008]